MELFKGTISEVKKEILTHTSGVTRISTKDRLFGGKDVVGSGSVETKHEHYTDFLLDGKAFRCHGDYIFKDGDEVVLYAEQSNQGFCKVVILKNFTHNFVIFAKKKRAIGEFLLMAVLGAPGLTLFLMLVCFVVYFIVRIFVDVPENVHSIVNKVSEYTLKGFFVLFEILAVYGLFDGLKSNKNLAKLNAQIQNYPKSELKK